MWIKFFRGYMYASRTYFLYRWNYLHGYYIYSSFPSCFETIATCPQSVESESNDYVDLYICYNLCIALYFGLRI
jgi:hypothetical protein